MHNIKDYTTVHNTGNEFAANSAVLNITPCHKVDHLLAASGWGFLGLPVFSTNKIYCHDITKILLNI
jgi:hypothetical protein